MRRIQQKIIFSGVFAFYLWRVDDIVSICIIKLDHWPALGADGLTNTAIVSRTSDSIAHHVPRSINAYSPSLLAVRNA
jgi:hypothetical protein